jgi:hypothetical protein
MSSIPQFPHQSSQFGVGFRDGILIATRLIAAGLNPTRWQLASLPKSDRQWGYYRGFNAAVNHHAQ